MFCYGCQLNCADTCALKMCDFLKLKKALLKSGYFVTKYTFCSLILMFVLPVKIFCI